MTNVNRWYCTRESVKAALGVSGAGVDGRIDRNIESASESIEKLTGRVFIPVTAIRYYPWPQIAGNSLKLFLDEDLLAVTLLRSEAQDASPTTIASTDYFLEPVNDPPYQRIEIDLSSSSSFNAGDTSQRSIAVTGRWGYSEATKAAGALAEALDASETGVDVTDASLIGVGDTILCESEAMFVSGRATLTTGTTLNDTLVALENDVTVTVASGAAIKQGEVILLDSERMLVESISGNDLTVVRGYDGSILAAHTTGITIYAFRTLTVVRGVNGTTAATHDTATALTKYAPPADIVTLCEAEALALLKHGQGAFTGEIGGAAGVMDRGGIEGLREQVRCNYSKVTL